MQDLEYFKEFLEEPEKYVHGDFHRLFVEWLDFIRE